MKRLILLFAFFAILLQFNPVKAQRYSTLNQYVKYFATAQGKFNPIEGVWKVYRLRYSAYNSSNSFHYDGTREEYTVVIENEQGLFREYVFNDGNLVIDNEPRFFILSGNTYKFSYLYMYNDLCEAFEIKTNIKFSFKSKYLEGGYGYKYLFELTYYKLNEL